MEIMTRQQAIQIGSKKYYLGKPCKNGHVSPRTTLTSACDGCISGYKKAAQKKLFHRAFLSSGGKGYTYEVTVVHDDKPMVDRVVALLNTWRVHPHGVNKPELLKNYMDALDAAEQLGNAK